MSITCRQATEKDFDKIISFLDKCYQKDFKALLPKVYLHKEYASSHLLLEEDNKIIAVIGNFVNQQYGFSFVGSVAIDPEYQNRGLLRKLFEEVDKFNKENKVNFTFLTGDKYLYEKYGYYRVGALYGFRFIEKSMNYLMPTQYDDIYFMSANKDDEEKLYEIYKASTKAVYRSKDRFIETCLSYDGKLMEIRKSGAIIGYFIINQMGMIGEIALSDPIYLTSVIHLLNHDQGQSIVMMNHDNPLFSEAKKYADSFMNLSFLSAKIYDLDAFMKYVFILDSNYKKEDNSLLLGIDDKNFCFKIKNNEINVSVTDQEADIKLSMKKFMSLFTPEGLECTHKALRSLFPIYFDIPTSDHY